MAPGRRRDGEVTAFRFVGVVDAEQAQLMAQLKERVVQYNIGVVAGLLLAHLDGAALAFLVIDERRRGLRVAQGAGGADLRAQRYESA